MEQSKAISERFVRLTRRLIKVSRPGTQAAAARSDLGPPDAETQEGDEPYMGWTDTAPIARSTLAERRPTWTAKREWPASSFAGLGRRARAYLLDFQIVAGIMLAFLTLADWGAIPDRFGPSFIWVGMAALVLYEPLLVRLLGGTLGHRVMRLRVVSPSGGPLSLPRAVVRTVIKWATIGYASPVMVSLGTRRAPWDMVVGSLVVDERQGLRRATRTQSTPLTIPRGDAAP